MSTIYLPQKLVNRPEVDLYPFRKRTNWAFCIGFTINKQIEMLTGNEYKDKLMACLNAISWIEDNFCPDDDSKYSSHYRIIKIVTVYLDRGGIIVHGHYQELKYYAERSKKFGEWAEEYGVDTIKNVEYNKRVEFELQGYDLHKAIFIEHKIQLKAMSAYHFDIESEYYKQLQSASVFNRVYDMSFIYAIAYGKQQDFRAFQTIISLAALPIDIAEKPAIKALQTSLDLVAYLIDIDGFTQFSDKLFEYRGPVVLTNTYYSRFGNEKKDYNPNAPEEEGKWKTPTEDTYMRASFSSTNTDIEDFLKLNLTLAKEIQLAKAQAKAIRDKDKPY